MLVHNRYPKSISNFLKDQKRLVISLKNKKNRHILITNGYKISTSYPNKKCAGFPGGSVVKSPPANAGDAGDTGTVSVPGLGR